MVKTTRHIEVNDRQVVILSPSVLDGINVTILNDEQEEYLIPLSYDAVHELAKQLESFCVEQEIQSIRNK